MTICSLIRMTSFTTVQDKSWDGRPFQSNGLKSGGGLLCPLPWGAGSPSNTMSPGHLDSSKFQPFGHITPTLQTDRTDNCPIV